MTGRTLGEPYGLANDRGTFRSAAVEWARVTRVPWGAASADAEIYRMRDLARKWAAAGQIRDLLDPLLDDPLLPVRVAAAISLWQGGVDDVRQTLEELASLDDKVAKAAGTALRLKRRSL